MQRLVDHRLSFADDGVEMSLALEALHVDLVHGFGARRPGGLSEGEALGTAVDDPTRTWAQVRGAPLTDASPGEWGSDFDQAWFRGSFAMDEIAFFHRPSRTAFFADLIQASTIGS